MGVRGYKGQAEKLERFGASSGLCRTNFALMVSPFPTFSTLFPLLYDNKSDFLSLRLLLWRFNRKNRHSFSSLFALDSLQSSNYGSCPDLLAKSKLI